MPAYYHFRPLVLVILDGWGIAPAGAGNAISLANIPNYKRLLLTSPHGQLIASGEEVGLPKGEPGNSEVGHLNIGAGRVVYEDVSRINMSIADGSFPKNPGFNQLLEHQKQHKSQVHFIGLLGGSTVHSNMEHLLALLWLLKESGNNDVYLHLFTDGRDSPPTSSLKYINDLTIKLKNLGVGKIASISGRYWGMDRDNRWDRIEKAYLAITGESTQKNTSPENVILESYKKNVTDEFIEPTAIADQKSTQIKDGDSLIFFNFRADRIREIFKSLVLEDFKEFARKKVFQNLFVLTLTEYDKDFPAVVAFPPENVKLPLSRVISETGLSQIHIAETEKYAHVTYFFNGGREEPFSGEERILIPSPKVPTYDLKPEMSAYELTDMAVKKISSQMYEFAVINFANPDMVGHTGKIPETIKALETVDSCLGKISRAVESFKGCLVVTADHGNAEEMLNLTTGQMDTAHSTNPVPIIISQPSLAGYKGNFLSQGALCDVAPTILRLMGLSPPGSMTGRSLISSF